MKTYDIYARYTVKAESHDDALNRWDAGEAAFQEWVDVIEVDE